MPFIIAILVTALLGIGGTINSPPKSINVKQAVKDTPPVISCLSDTVAQYGIDPGTTRVPTILKNIKKPTRQNITRGYEIPLCQNVGSCDGPDQSDYILVATHVKADHVVYPNNFVPDSDISDRQLVKQTDFTDNPIMSDRYKNRLYRTFCGDWCSTCDPKDVVCADSECLTGTCKTDKPPVTLSFQGTYHCDFIFYLEESDDRGNPQIDENANFPAGKENDKLPELPANNSYFSIYFRSGTAVPDALKCPAPNTSGMLSVPQVFAQDRSSGIMNFPGSSDNAWQLVKNPASTNGSYIGRNTQLINLAKLGDVTNPVGLSGQYEIYKNLMDPESDILLYLVQPGTITEVLSGLYRNPPQIIHFPYFLLQNIQLTSGKQKTLKLSTFLPASDWIKKWVQESKPAIYLYPQKTTAVTVKLHPQGYLIVSDPIYNVEKGWQVIAHPDGTIQLPTIHNSPASPAGGQPAITYPYLFYEAQLDQIPHVTSGFVVNKKDLTSFFRSKLSLLGLNGEEIRDYLDYWMPRLNNQSENYFLIYFLNQKQIETLEPIDINMTVDSAIRIRTYFKPLQKPIDIPTQSLEKPVKRTGNTLVEWGGILDTP